MNNQTVFQQPTFSFSTIFYGRATSVAVVCDGGNCHVHLNGEPVARLKRNEEVQSWFVAGGELDDTDLVYDIATRLDARYR
jgi:hypothetical protein